MTQEEERYFENFINMFAMEGWKQLLQELEVRAEAHNVNSIDSEKNLFKAKGELAVISTILNFEMYIRQALDEPTTN